MSEDSRDRRREDFRRPLVDVYETEEQVVLQFELPGVDSGDVDVRVDGDTLRVETRGKGDQRAGEVVLREFTPANFYREFVLSKDLDRDSIAASWKNGVLTLTVAKEAAKTHKVAIETV